MCGPCLRKSRDPPARISTREAPRGTRIRKTADESDVSTVSRSIPELNDALPESARALDEVLARARQQDEEVAARRVEADAGDADPYKKPRVAADELDDEDDPDLDPDPAPGGEDDRA